MSVVANVAINVDATKAISQLGALNNASGQLESKIGGLGSKFGGLSSAIAGLGISALTQQLDADRTSKRIQSLAGANGEARQVFELAAKAAREFGLGTTEAEKGMADLYGRLRPSGIALKDIETTFFGVNKAALAMGLTGAEAEGVFLQLAQAMGSGKLQGDELRSIMEQLPAVGQAVAKVMGVTVGEVKQLGADGKITTEIMIKAAAELNKLKPPPPDAFKQFNAAMSDLRRELGENILPIITPLIQSLLGLVKAFGALPEPVQTMIVALGLVATAVTAIASAVAVLGPAFATISGAVAAAGPIIAGWAGAVAPAIAGITAAFSGLLAWLTGTLVPALVGIFSGPIGWTVLAVAAVIAMVALFREPISKFLVWLGGQMSAALQALGQLAYQALIQPWIAIWDIAKKPVNAFFQWIGGAVKWGLQALYAIAWQIWVQPWINIWNGILREPVTMFIEWMQGAWSQVVGFFQSKIIQPIQSAWAVMVKYLQEKLNPIGNWFKNFWSSIVSFFSNTIIKPLQQRWQSMVNFLRDAMAKVAGFVPSIWNGILNTIRSAINRVLNAIGSSINSVARAINRLIAGFNQLPGPDIGFVPFVSVPQFAEGGIVSSPTLAMVGEGGQREYIIPESKMAAASAAYMAGARGKEVFNGGGGTTAPVININTGPVVEFDGKRYVSIEDLEQAMRITAQGVIGQLRTPAARIALRGA
jgi:tape measure domain-containing protein